MSHTEAVCKLFTALYRKASDCAALLHFHSSYSLKFKETIVFFAHVLDTTSSLQMTPYYKKNSIPSQYLSFSDNTL